MARKEYGAEDRNFEDPFEASRPTDQPPTKSLVSFIDGLKLLQKKLPDFKYGEDDLKQTVREEWLKFVTDEEILKCNDRKKLKKYLDKLLEGLKKYTSKTAKGFPHGFELLRLTEVVLVMAKVIGKQKGDFGDLLSAMKRIENRSKVSLVEFADQLRNRLSQIPASPASVVHRAAEQNTTAKPTLEAVKYFLTGKTTADKSTPWVAWYNTIQKLVFPTSGLMPTSNGKLPQLTGSEEQRTLMAYLLMMDLRRQQLEWSSKYGQPAQVSLQWIYLLQRQEDYDLLTQTFYSTALAPDKMTKVINTLGDRERRMRSYKKSHHKHSGLAPQ